MLRIIGVMAAVAILAAWRAKFAYESAAKRRVPAGFSLAAGSLRLAEGFRVEGMIVPTADFRAGRSRIAMETVSITGEIWPPFGDCSARIAGLRMDVSALRPSAAMSALFDVERLAGGICPRLSADSGEIVVADSPPIRLSLERAVWRQADGAVEAWLNAMDGQPTHMALKSKRGAGGVETRGEWNLSGMDVSGLLRRIGIQWSSRTEIGVLEFESAGDARRERGEFTVAGWVLMGAGSPNPFRLSAPEVRARFQAGDSEIRFEDIRVSNPAYDLIGAQPEMFRAFLSQGPAMWLGKRPSRAPRVDVAKRHEQKISALPDAFSVRVDTLKIDSGTAFLIDRAERTQFVLKAGDVVVEVTGPASFYGRTPNTTIRFRMNDRQAMQWRAITDFSTWPPLFRLTDVREGMGGADRGETGAGRGWK